MIAKAGRKTAGCSSCGKKTTAAGHLCTPAPALYVCQFCGVPSSDARHVCMPKLSAMTYYCGGCGRVATKSDLLCFPKKIPSGSKKALANGAIKKAAAGKSAKSVKRK